MVKDDESFYESIRESFESSNVSEKSRDGSEQPSGKETTGLKNMDC